MKKYTKIEKLEYREYKHSDFKDVFSIFCQFQANSPIDSHRNVCEGASETFKHMYLLSEFEKTINKCNKKYIGFIPETGEIIGFAIFSENYYSKNCLELQLACKKPKYIFTKCMKDALFSVINEIKGDRKVVTVLGGRYKFEKYMKFIKRIIKIKIIKVDQFKNTMVEILI